MTGTNVRGKSAQGEEDGREDGETEKGRGRSSQHPGPPQTDDMSTTCPCPPPHSIHPWVWVRAVLPDHLPLHHSTTQMLVMLHILAASLLSSFTEPGAELEPGSIEFCWKTSSHDGAAQSELQVLLWI
ncbi:uncharacterized protein ACNS7B_013786 [Menidia menidia]